MWLTTNQILSHKTTHYTLQSVTPSTGGKALLELWGKYEPGISETDLPVGGKIYISGSGLYDGLQTILQEIYTGPVTRGWQTRVVEIDASYAGSAVKGDVVSRQRGNDYVQAQLSLKTGGGGAKLSVYASGGMEKTYAPLLARPGIVGEAYFDMAALIKPHLSFDDDFDYDSVNRADKQVSWSGKLAINGGVPTDVFMLNAILPAGKSIDEYVPRPGSLAKWLTDTGQPVYYNGYPFSLSFIYHQTGAGEAAELFKKEITRDINGEMIGEQQTALDVTQQGWVNRLMLAGNYDENVHSVDVALHSGQSATGGVFVPGVMDADAFHAPTITGAGGEQVTETINVAVSHQCHRSPAYITWLNALGGREYRLFHTSQQEMLQVQDNGAFTPWEPAGSPTSPAAVSTLGKQAQTEITLGASQLTAPDVQQLKGLLHSPKVYIMDAQANKTPVYIIPGSFHLLNTAEQMHEVSFSYGAQVEL